VINNNTWNHFVWTLGSDGTWKIYLNGVLNNVYTGRLYPTLGDRNTNTWGTGYDNALIDEFQQYNRVLTVSEITAIYAGTITYNSGAGPSVVATDSKFGTKSLYFPGTTYSGAVGLSPITLVDPSFVTISAWVKFNSLDSTPRTIFSMANATNIAMCNKCGQGGTSYVHMNSARTPALAGAYVRGGAVLVGELS
jgi:hypothetical protein